MLYFRQGDNGGMDGVAPASEPVAGRRRSDGRITAEQVLEAAERLFAERGIEAVSLREVGKAASSRNTGVAHYHFGGKEGLVRAIVARRAPALNGRRLEMLQQAGTPALPADLVRMLVIPLAEETERGGYYVGFLARLAAERFRYPWLAELDESSASSFRKVVGLLAEALPGLDRRRFRHRLEMLTSLVIGSLAARVQAEALGAGRLAARADYVEDLLEAASGLMLAPVGPDRHDPADGPVSL
jgi:AcrR family transcriptional regulator